MYWLKSLVRSVGPALVVFGLLGVLDASARGGVDVFCNFESPPVHPLDLTPSGDRLLATNTAAGRLEVFRIDAGGGLAWERSIDVGIDPIAVRARNEHEAWVVHRISDSIDVVDLQAGVVVAVVPTDDEPGDVVFAGSPSRAFVACGSANRLQIFDPQSLAAGEVGSIALKGLVPRALATSADGALVFAAFFESGNGTTALAGGAKADIGFPPLVVNNPVGPYGGQNPPPNAGTSFVPPINPLLPPPPRVALIVREGVDGRWRDDNAGDWSELVTGDMASLSGRPVGWKLLDNDLAVIDAASHAVVHVRRLMNICAALAVHPLSGDVVVVGSDSSNEVRFEPNLRGVFVRSQGARVSQQGISVYDLNPHLDYSVGSLPMAERKLSIGDPRAIAWHPSGDRGYVAGRGSNNVVIVDQNGARAVHQPTIATGAGPCGLVHHPTLSRLFSFNLFDGTISVIDSDQDLEVARMPLLDPTPAVVRAGRRHLYDTHATSGLGQASCASCHVDSATDRLAWDLGDPSGNLALPLGANLGAGIPNFDLGFEAWHPMKGPMLTQTLRDIIGKEPLHWRGDRNGIEDFNPAYESLLGADGQLDDTQMAELKEFLRTLRIPPNPYRDVRNRLRTHIELVDQYSSGKFAPKGTPLPIADAQRGLTLFRTIGLDPAQPLACITCHTLPTGLGTDSKWNGVGFDPLPPGFLGQRHHMLVGIIGTTNSTLKVPELRTLYRRLGFDTSQVENLAGFGYLNDGSIDTLAQFITEPNFPPQSLQDVADLIGFLLSFAGSDLPEADGSIPLLPPGTAALDSHAALGRQVSWPGAAAATPEVAQLVQTMRQLADQGQLELIVKGPVNGERRGYRYDTAGLCQSDRLAETVPIAVLLSSASPTTPLLLTLVAPGTQTRLGIDADTDGHFDRDELDAGSDPADLLSVPGCGLLAPFGSGCAAGGLPAPRLQVAGCVSTGGVLKITVSGGEPEANLWLVFGAAPAAIPVLGCTLNVAPLIGAAVGPIGLTGGDVTMTGVLPTVPGGSLVMQGFAIGPSLQLGATNAVRIDT